MTICVVGCARGWPPKAERFFPGRIPLRHSPLSLSLSLPPSPKSMRRAGERANGRADGRGNDGVEWSGVPVQCFSLGHRRRGRRRCRRRRHCGHAWDEARERRREGGEGADAVGRSVCKGRALALSLSLVRSLPTRRRDTQRAAQLFPSLPASSFTFTRERTISRSPANPTLQRGRGGPEAHRAQDGRIGRTRHDTRGREGGSAEAQVPTYVLCPPRRCFGRRAGLPIRLPPPVRSPVVSACCTACRAGG